VGKRNRLRRKLWKFFQSNPFWFFVGLLITFREWVAETISILRNEVARAVDAIVAVPPRWLLTIAAVLALPFLLHRLRLLRRPKPIQLTATASARASLNGSLTTVPASHNTVITPRTGSLLINAANDPLPPTNHNDTGAWIDVEAAQSHLRAGSSRINGTGTVTAPPPPGWPIGNDSAVVMANQPTIERRPMPSPTFVNNSHWMQWEAAQRQHDLAARIAMKSTMPKFNPAFLSATN
jgi:hypothetical protein